MTETSEQENARLKRWIEDLLGGGYVNCVYCGYRYGPHNDTATSMSDVLKEHVMQCEHHPMAKYREALESIVARGTPGGVGAAVCVTTETLVKIAKQALED